MPTESQLRDAALRLRICQLIDDGRLPVMMAERIYGGYGSGGVCDACNQPITSTQVQYDVEDECDPTHHRLSFHMGCHVVWQLECVLRAKSGGASAPADH